MLNLHRVLFCTGIDPDNIMQIDCFAYKYFVFYRVSLVGYSIWYCVVCDYSAPPQSVIDQKSEFLKLISIRIIFEFLLMCALNTLLYLSHKMVKIMFL